MEPANSKYFVPFPFAVPLFIFGFVSLHFSGPMNLLVFLLPYIFMSLGLIITLFLAKDPFFSPLEVLLICYYPNQC